MRTVLVLDDNQTFLDDFESLRGESFKVLTAQTEGEAFDILGDRKVDVMLLDVMLSEGQSGMDVLKRVKDAIPDCPVIMLTAHASVESAVEAMRLGAYHYISKSPKIEELKTLVEKAFAERELKRDYELLREEVERVSGRIVGARPVMQRVFEAIQRVFVTVNCASLVKELIESELFGHQKGSFTGATQTKLRKLSLPTAERFFLMKLPRCRRKRLTGSVAPVPSRSMFELSPRQIGI